MDLQINRCIVCGVADDVTDCKDGKEKEKFSFILINCQKRVSIKDREIGAKAEEQNGLRDKCIVMG